MELGVKGKNVLITGATKGIGWATALAFLQAGCKVFLNGHNKNILLEKCRELNKQYPDMVHPCYADVTLANDVKAMAKEIGKLTGALDIAVMNVGVGKSLTNNSLDSREWRRFYEVNTLSAVEVLNELYPLMQKGSRANVVLVSSVVARERSSAPIGYAAAKAAVLELNRYLSAQWAKDNIRVNCVLPGNVFFSGGRWEELLLRDERGTYQYISENVPLNRFGRPEEIADAILFLASARASFITGAALNVDGGQQRSV